MRKLYMADIPDDPQNAASWPLTEILDTSTVTTAIKQEGMAAFDVDGDGRVDLLAGIYWFKHQGGNEFQPIQIADHPVHRRRTLQTGQGRPNCARARRRQRPPLVHRMSGRPDGSQSWMCRPLLDRDVLSGHTLAVADINADGNLDIFCAEMHTPGPKEKCTAWVLYGDGQGQFQVQQLSVGIGNHDSRVADVNGDGRLDIVNPFIWHTPRVEVWPTRQLEIRFDHP